MSKKETEFERYDRMKKLQREAEVEKKKYSELLTQPLFEGESKKRGRAKQPKPLPSRISARDFDWAYADEFYDEI